ncbi:hypothetical protein JCM8547_002334 [Rhodosporidiobolus lusitaniae]
METHLHVAPRPPSSLLSFPFSHSSSSLASLIVRSTTLMPGPRKSVRPSPPSAQPVSALTKVRVHEQTSSQAASSGLSKCKAPAVSSDDEDEAQAEEVAPAAPAALVEPEAYRNAELTYRLRDMPLAGDWSLAVSNLWQAKTSLT